MDKTKIEIQNITYEYSNMYSESMRYRNIIGIRVTAIYKTVELKHYIVTSKDLTPEEIKELLVDELNG